MGIENLGLAPGPDSQPNDLLECSDLWKSTEDFIQIFYKTLFVVHVIIRECVRLPKVMTWSWFLEVACQIEGWDSNDDLYGGQEMSSPTTDVRKQSRRRPPLTSLWRQAKTRTLRGDGNARRRRGWPVEFQPSNGQVTSRKTKSIKNGKARIFRRTSYRSFRGCHREPT